MAEHESLERLCMFIGPDRGGQGLVGAMLDAHPSAVVARSFSVFEDLGARGRPRFSDPAEMFDEIIKADRKTAVRGRQSVRIRPRQKAHITPLAIEGQGHRRGQRLTVIGTDGAPETARALSANPAALQELESVSGLELRLIQVVRNPFDNLVSMAIAAPHQPVFGVYRWIAETIAESERKREILRVHLEDLAAEPASELTRICEFLGLEASEEYLSACTEIVENPPHRYGRTWPQPQINEVDQLMATFPWLERYRSARPEPKEGSAASVASIGADPETSFDDLRTFCAFVGHTRSGHSLVGALIDAHPNAIVSHHGRLFGKQKMAGTLALPDREKLFRSLIDQSIVRAAGRGPTGQRRTREGGRERYSYAVSGGWQGRFTELFVLGTQHARELSNALEANPGALDELSELVGVRLRLISMVRNPWDHLESMGRGVAKERSTRRAEILNAYLVRSRMIQLAKESGYDVLDVALEEFIADPRTELRRICEFLGLEPLPDYLEACSSVVFDSPNTTRREHDWTEEEIDAITAAIDEFPWLERYRAVEVPAPAPA